MTETNPHREQELFILANVPQERGYNAALEYYL
jgi:hypothetical protein